MTRLPPSAAAAIAKNDGTDYSVQGDRESVNDMVTDQPSLNHLFQRAFARAALESRAPSSVFPPIHTANECITTTTTTTSRRSTTRVRELTGVNRTRTGAASQDRVTNALDAARLVMSSALDPDDFAASPNTSTQALFAVDDDGEVEDATEEILTGEGDETPHHSAKDGQ